MLADGSIGSIQLDYATGSLPIQANCTGAGVTFYTYTEWWVGSGCLSFGSGVSAAVRRYLLGTAVVAGVRQCRLHYAQRAVFSGETVSEACGLLTEATDLGFWDDSLGNDSGIASVTGVLSCNPLDIVGNWCGNVLQTWNLTEA